MTDPKMEFCWICHEVAPCFHNADRRRIDELEQQLAAAVAQASQPAYEALYQAMARLEEFRPTDDLLAYLPEPEAEAVRAVWRAFDAARLASEEAPDG